VLDAAGKLGKILVGMNRALGEIPLTVKLRTGVKEGRNNAHRLMPRIGAEWNVAAMTVGLSYPISLRKVTYMMTLCERSYMGGQDSSDTQSWQIGNTSKNVSKLFAHAKPTRIVRDSPILLHVPLMTVAASKCRESPSSVVAMPFPPKITGPRWKAVVSMAS
jgi:hypothetical protein